MVIPSSQNSFIYRLCSDSEDESGGSGGSGSGGSAVGGISAPNGGDWKGGAGAGTPPENNDLDDVEVQ